MPRRITRRIEISPDFRDINLMGVAHNCVYFEWFERGRLALLSEALDFETAREFGIAAPVAKNSCEYEIPVRLGDRLELITRHRIDDTYTGKLVFTHELRNLANGATHAFGESVCAIIDMATMKPLAQIPERVREKYDNLK